MFNWRPAQSEGRLADQPAVEFGTEPRPTRPATTATTGTRATPASPPSAPANRRGTYGYYRWYHLRRQRRRLQRQPGHVPPGQLEGQQEPHLEPRHPHGTRVPAQLLQAGHGGGASDRILLGQKILPASAAPGIRRAPARAALRVVGLLLRRDEVRDAPRQLRRRHLHRPTTTRWTTRT